MDNNTSPELSKKQKALMKLKFFLFSVSAGAIQLLTTTILNTVVHLDRYSGLDELLGHEFGLAYFIGLVLSVIWNFTLNRKFTFKSANNVPIAMLKMLGFYCVFAPLSIWWTVKLTDLNWPWLVVQLGTMLVNLVTEYLFCQFVVYKGSIYTNDAAKEELARTK